MVIKLHAEVVQVDDEVTEAEMQEFWNEHESEYYEPESRSGRMVICEGKAQAKLAKSDLEGERPFGEVLEEYGTNIRNKRYNGEFGPIQVDPNNGFTTAVFAAPLGEWTEPIPYQDSFIIAIADEQSVGYQPDLAESAEDVKRRIILKKRDTYLRQLLADWRQEFGVEIFEDNLAKMPSWDELRAAEASQDQPG
jgi:hypothetical protein